MAGVLQHCVVVKLVIQTEPWVQSHVRHQPRSHLTQTPARVGTKKYAGLL